MRTRARGPGGCAHGAAYRDAPRCRLREHRAQGRRDEHGRGWRHDRATADRSRRRAGRPAIARGHGLLARPAAAASAVRAGHDGEQPSRRRARRTPVNGGSRRSPPAGRATTGTPPEPRTQRRPRAGAADRPAPSVPFRKPDGAPRAASGRGDAAAACPGRRAAARRVASVTAKPRPRRPSAAAADPSIPVFDVVRVEPTGDAVIAGRGVPRTAPSKSIRNGTVHASGLADGSGLFALAAPAAAAGLARGGAADDRAGWTRAPARARPSRWWSPTAARRRSSRSPTRQADGGALRARRAGHRDAAVARHPRRPVPRPASPISPARRLGSIAAPSPPTCLPASPPHAPATPAGWPRPAQRAGPSPAREGVTRSPRSPVKVVERRGGGGRAALRVRRRPRPARPCGST